MFASLITTILALFGQLIGLILTPLNDAISSLSPNVSEAFSHINIFFDWLGGYASFAMSYLGIKRQTITICIGLFYARIMIPFTAHTFKLIAKWWEVLV